MSINIRRREEIIISVTYTFTVSRYIRTIITNIIILWSRDKSKEKNKKKNINSFN
jgi:hypothetical protein